ncbi:uncharacterized protein LOC109716786 [Ananas comosus]|uniref:Uncharacterized protein LOC109705782 n=1 Tax=Ananas comosus TaxID=4615 RepID=A0A6P5FNR7_ANACO|nr:uncharacterized protein LOC109705782 [Ananas comosus]XP_020097946.1 uncharacterized protein LOC109716786 [Ananas comosus]
MEWYWQITRRWISRPVQRPPLTYQPRGQIERALVDALRQAQMGIRGLVHDRPSYDAMVETLTSMDVHIESVLEYIPSIPVAADVGGRDFGQPSTSGHHRRHSPTSTVSYSRSSLRVSRSPSPSDVADILAAPSRFPSLPLDLDSLPPPVSREHFRLVYSRRHAASSSQVRPASTPATIEGDRPESEETQAVPEHPEGIIIADLDQMAGIEALDDVPIAELDVQGGRRRGRGRGRRGRGRSRD